MTDRTRVTPFDVVFGTADFGEQRFRTILEQEHAGSSDTRETLMQIPAAGALLRELLPGAGGQPHTEFVTQVSALLFQAYRFWRAGRAVYRLTTSAFERVLALEPGSATVGVPAVAGYMQLPRNALWARVGEDAAPEPVDGFFWSTPEALQPAAAAHAVATPTPIPPPATYLPHLDLLFALGVRAGRPGISTVDVTIAPADLSQWARTSARAHGVDFANILPGGELQGYHAVTTRAEAVKLASLCFAWVQQTNAMDVVTESADTVRIIDG